MERPSRIGLISLLLAVEVVIAGFAFYTLRGSSFGSTGGGMSRVDYTAPALAPVLVGLSPHVTIDDVDSGVSVTTSNDPMVHVTDRTEAHGFFWGGAAVAKPVITRTADGVSIFRPESHRMGVMFGYSRQHIDVQVPEGTRLTIVRSSGATISGLHNDIDVASQDGRITFDRIVGNIKAHSNDGRIVGHDLQANQLDLSTDDGRIELSNVQMTGATPRAQMHTKDGPMIVSGIFPANGTYSLTTADGRVELSLMAGSDTTVEASTGDGHVTVNGQRADGQQIRAGAGNATMRVRTEDGSVHITTNGAQ